MPIRELIGHSGPILDAEFSPSDQEIVTASTDETARVWRTATGALLGVPSNHHNYVLREGEGKGPRLAARVTEPKSGRIMKVLTTEPGIQFYSGNFLDGKVKGKGGVAYRKHAGFCLEAQHFPDAVHHKNFPSIILEPGKTYTQTTLYHFSAK